MIPIPHAAERTTRLKKLVVRSAAWGLVRGVLFRTTGVIGIIRQAMREGSIMGRGWLVVAAAGIVAGTAASADGAPKVRVDGGQVVGAARGPAVVFRAIPYAAPPLGALRWKPPAAVAAWTGDRPATDPGPACPQKVSPTEPNIGGYKGPTSEDCLTLDVTAPRDARKAPVMVWIYGGGNVAGAANLPSYDATGFARDGVVLVAMNYRLGPLGFFAHPALTAEAPKSQPLVSYGLMDQVAALKWVKRNIAAFGGDPGNVTLFGESAGGEDVLQLMVMPAAHGLFHKAIVESGGGWGPLPNLKAAEAAGEALATKVGLPGSSATAAQLRALPADTLTAAGGRAGPAIDGRLVRESPEDAFARGDQAAVPLIIGSNSNEASLMRAFGGQPAELVAKAPPAVRAAYGAEAQDEATFGRQIFNDAVMGAPARWIAAKASAKAPAWLYYFSYVPERQRLVRPGTNHASEIPFVFDSLEAVPGRAALITPSERATASFAHSCWVGFAKTGRPACAGATWPAYTAASDQLLEFADPPAVRAHFRKAQLDAQQARAAPPGGKP
jgi:para-nitrobenzyl esterase